LDNTTNTVVNKGVSFFLLIASATGCTKQGLRYIPIAYRLHTVDLAMAFVTDHFWFQQLRLQSCLEISTELTQHINLFCKELYTPLGIMFPSLVVVTLN
jgi:hypothetical protein